MASGPNEKTLSTGWSGKSSRTFRKSTAAAAERPTDTDDAGTGVQPSALLENLQIERELQNEELRRTQADLEASRARCFELYELAPVGYVTLNAQGVILEMNLRAATIFGPTRAAWNGLTFEFYIVAEDQGIFYLSHKRLFEAGLPQIVELRMHRQGIPFWARLEMILEPTDRSIVSRTVIVDINDSKIVELQLRESQRRFERLLAEKRTLIREVHHRVKNNFQVISSLLRMQAGLLNDERASAALNNSQQRILSMALIHELLYRDDSMDQIDFGEYTRSLVDELCAAYADASGLVGKCLSTSRVLLNADQAIPCGLILNELLTNAFKYAYPDGETGEVRVDLKETPSGLVTLTVSDQGVGLPEGVDWNTSKSLGLPIVDVLTQQLRGTLTVGSPPGASFIIEFQKEAKSLDTSD
jgi:PAS domain S-box-containing protein